MRKTGVLAVFCLARALLGNANPALATNDSQVLSSLAEAKTILAASEVGFGVKKTTLSRRDKTGKLIRVERFFVSQKEMVLAVLHQNGGVSTVKVILSRPEADQKFTILAAEPEDCAVDKTSGEGVSEIFCVNCGKGDEIVLATLRLLGLPNGLMTLSEKEKLGPDRIIYSAYYDYLALPQIIEKGRAYIVSQISQAREELVRRHVLSRAMPGTMIVDLFPEKILLVLSIIEHIDHDEFREKGPSYTANKVFTQFGLNGEHTFNRAVSHAGAMCLMQIMSGTYRETRALYPEAGLSPFARLGACDNHRDAIMAAYLVLDAKLSLMPTDFKNKFLRDPDSYAIFLAAAYNGGEKRASTLHRNVSLPTLQRTLDEFYGAPASRNKKLWVMKKETWIFVKKYRDVSEMLSFEQAAP